MDTLDNQTIIKLVIGAAVAYVLYKAWVKRNENFSQNTRLDYSYITPAEQADATAIMPPTYMPPMSVATDLLPKPVQGMDDFTEYAPKGNLQGMSFLDPTATIGVDTQGSSRRNPNLQLRADPPCSRLPPGQHLPAPVSDISPDKWRLPLDDCYR